MIRRILFLLLIAAGAFIAYWSFGGTEARQQLSDAWKKMTQSAEDTLAIPNATQTASTQQQGFINRVVSQTSEPNTIRIASWNISLTKEKANEPLLSQIAETISQFDVVALQGLRRDQLQIARMVIAKISQLSDPFEMYLSPSSDYSETGHQFAFVYNTKTIDFNRKNTYSVDDPDNLFEYNPFVGWFAAKTKDSKTAFTFSLVNMNADAFRAQRENQLIGRLYQSIRRDGWGEDDVIMLGSLNASPEDLEFFTRTYSLEMTNKTPTDVTFERHTSSMLVYPKATIEFTGEGGVFNFLRAYNLTIEEAQAISHHNPVWAEFRIREGAASRIARRISSDF